MCVCVTFSLIKLGKFSILTFSNRGKGCQGTGIKEKWGMRVGGGDGWVSGEGRGKIETTILEKTITK